MVGWMVVVAEGNLQRLRRSVDSTGFRWDLYGDGDSDSDLSFRFRSRLRGWIRPATRSSSFHPVALVVSSCGFELCAC